MDAIEAIPGINGDGWWEMIAGGRQGNLFCYSGGMNAEVLVADFIASTTSGPIPLTVNFTDLSTGSIVSWQWDFDNDGTIDSEEENPVYTYTEPGIYSVRLNISNGINTDELLKTDYIIADTAVGIPNKDRKDAFTISPNPFTHSTIIKLPHRQELTSPLNIYNNNGRLIKTLKAKKSEGYIYYFWDRTNNGLQKVNRGIYYGLINDHGSIIDIKIIAN